MQIASNRYDGPVVQSQHPRSTLLNDQADLSFQQHSPSFRIRNTSLKQKYYHTRLNSTSFKERESSAAGRSHIEHATSFQIRNNQQNEFSLKLCQNEYGISPMEGFMRHSTTWNNTSFFKQRLGNKVNVVNTQHLPALQTKKQDLQSPSMSSTASSSLHNYLVRQKYPADHDKRVKLLVNTSPSIAKKKKQYQRSKSILQPESEEQVLFKQFILDNPPPFVTASAWVVASQSTGEVLFGRQESEQRQVASLTKLMTAYVTLDLASRLQVNIYETLVRVPLQACELIGTSANLLQNEKLTIFEMLHAMMLPSGNDAAQSLAVFFGRILAGQSLSEDYYTELFDDEAIEGYLVAFYKQMNTTAICLGLENSHFQSAHGMHHEQNFSTAEDIAKLSFKALKMQIFRQVVKTQTFTCNSRLSSDYSYTWVNTNKLLESGYDGLKTGITPTAGPCLAASLAHCGVKLVVVILNSKSMEQRWAEVPKLVEWSVMKIQRIAESGLKPKAKRKLMMKLLPKAAQVRGELLDRS